MKTIDDDSILFNPLSLFSKRSPVRPQEKEEAKNILHNFEKAFSRKIAEEIQSEFNSRTPDKKNPDGSGQEDNNI